jgi:hypothetical protein
MRRELLVVLAMMLFFGPSRSQGPRDYAFAQDAYVWQRHWN